MSWTTASLKVPDETSWIALVEVGPDGTTSLIGYLSQPDFVALADVGKNVGRLFDDWCES